VYTRRILINRNLKLVSLLLALVALGLIHSLQPTISYLELPPFPLRPLIRPGYSRIVQLLLWQIGRSMRSGVGGIDAVHPAKQGQT
jgi:hypothetical protein